jgi:hypothetical protein
MPEILADIPDFVVKVIYNWWLFVTCGIMVAIYLIERKRGKPFPWTQVAYGAGIFLIPAFYLAWQREHSDLEGLKRANEQLKLKAEVCPPVGVVAVPGDHEWHDLPPGAPWRIPESRTQRQFGKSPAAIQVSVDKGSVRFLDTGDIPTRFRGL